MTKYTHEKEGSLYSIKRNGDLVASYDPISEDVKYYLNGSRYSGPIGKEVASIVLAPVEPPLAVKEPDAPAEPPEPAKPPQEMPPPPPATKVEKSTPRETRDAKLIESLKREVHDLKAHISGERKLTSPSARHLDDIDLSESPVRSKMRGDCTPEFIEWARTGGGGFTEEIFIRQYKGRIPDITFKGK
tara:strand:- start:3446 stop:4009 length:564 start_codon:yes stop_codon:yes gene_type:complete